MVDKVEPIAIATNNACKADTATAEKVQDVTTNAIQDLPTSRHSYSPPVVVEENSSIPPPSEESINLSPRKHSSSANLSEGGLQTNNSGLFTSLNNPVPLTMNTGSASLFGNLSNNTSSTTAATPSLPSFGNSLLLN